MKAKKYPKPIKYAKVTYKYIILEDYEIKFDRSPDHDIYTEFVDFLMDGTFRIKKGFLCDGASGPTIDTPTSLKGAFIHDGGYYLLRKKELGLEWRKYFDNKLKEICIDSGMNQIRAEVWNEMVEKFAGYAAKPKRIKVMLAP